jgi:hypothetical protein
LAQLDGAVRNLRGGGSRSEHVVGSGEGATASDDGLPEGRQWHPHKKLVQYFTSLGMVDMEEHWGEGDNGQDGWLASTLVDALVGSWQNWMALSEENRSTIRRRVAAGVCSRHGWHVEENPRRVGPGAVR